MNQRELNNFKRKYFDLSKKRALNTIIDDPGAGKAHRELLHRVCEWLQDIKLPFYTRVYLKEGEIVDIVVPSLPKPLIEIRHSELGKTKIYCPEYNDLRVFIDVLDPYKLL